MITSFVIPWAVDETGRYQSHILSFSRRRKGRRRLPARPGIFCATTRQTDWDRGDKAERKRIENLKGIGLINLLWISWQLNRREEKLHSTQQKPQVASFRVGGNTSKPSFEWLHQTAHFLTICPTWHNSSLKSITQNTATIPWTF